MATWAVEAQELETEPLRYPAPEKSQVRRQEMIQISSSQSQDWSQRPAYLQELFSIIKRKKESQELRRKSNEK